MWFTQFNKLLSIFLCCINWPNTTYHTYFALFLKTCNFKGRLPFYVNNLGGVSETLITDLIACTEDDSKVFNLVQ